MNAQAPNSRPPGRLPNRDTDVIVEALAAVIEHAGELQTQAEVGVRALGGAAVKTSRAAENLVEAAQSLQSQLTEEVAKTVGERFDSSVESAGETITQDVRAKLGGLLREVSSFEKTVRQAQISIERQTREVAAKALTYMAVGAAIGVAAVAVGAAAIFYALR
nr:hypothetical protein [uncultured Roseateles sp.]